MFFPAASCGVSAPKLYSRVPGSGTVRRCPAYYPMLPLTSEPAARGRGEEEGENFARARARNRGLQCGVLRRFRRQKKPGKPLNELLKGIPFAGFRKVGHEPKSSSQKFPSILFQSSPAVCLGVVNRPSRENIGLEPREYSATLDYSWNSLNSKAPDGSGPFKRNLIFQVLCTNDFCLWEQG